MLHKLFALRSLISLKSLAKLKSLLGSPEFDEDGPEVRRLVRRTAFWLFAFLQCAYLLTASGRLHTTDEYEAYYMAESLVERGELALPAEKSFFGRRAENGKFYAPYGPLLSAAAAPGYAAGKAVGEALLEDERQRESLNWLFASSVNTTIGAACVTVFFLLAMKLGASIAPAIVAALLYAFATPHWHYATTFFSEPISALLLLSSVYYLTSGFVDRQGEKELRLRSLVLASVPLALSTWSRLTMAIYHPVLAILVFILSGGSVGRRLRAAGGFCFLPLISIALALGWNMVRFGDPLQPGYPDGTEGQLSPTGLGGEFLSGLYALVASEGKGLLILALPTVVSLVLARRFLTRTGLFGCCLLLLPVTALVFFSRYEHVEGGYCWGPRYLIPSISFLLLPLAFNDFKVHLLRWLLGTAVVYSTLVQTLGVSVSFMETQVERDYYLDGYIYNTGYSALRETADVFMHYVREAFAGNFLAGAEGLGFDYWFLFLAKSGFSGWWIAAAVGCVVLVGVFAAFKLCTSALGVVREKLAALAPELPATAAPARKQTATA